MSGEKPDKKNSLHVALIMDGNRRWARAHGLPHVAGHERVASSIGDCVGTAPSLGIRWLTLYAFSTENWRRSPEEVRYLMEPGRWLLGPEQVSAFASTGVAVRFIGALQDPRIPSHCREWIEYVEERTKAAYPALTVTIAFNYGGRAEILDGVRRVVAAGANLDDPSNFEAALWSGELPDVDLLVRTSGEQRLSNFLLWRCGYAELFFTPALWPEFGGNALTAAVAEYQRRKRTFGGDA